MDKIAFHQPLGKFETIVSLDDLKFLSVQAIENQQPLYSMEWSSPCPLCWVTCKLAYEGDRGNAPNIFIMDKCEPLHEIVWSDRFTKIKIKKLNFKFMFNKQRLVIIMST